MLAIFGSVVVCRRRSAALASHQHSNRTADSFPTCVPVNEIWEFVGMGEWCFLYNCPNLTFVIVTRIVILTRVRPKIREPRPPLDSQLDDRPGDRTRNEGHPEILTLSRSSHECPTEWTQP